jgi:hypothetical protein
MPSAPVLLPIGIEEKAYWTWSGPDPVQWRIEQSEDGVGEWVEFEVVDGSLRNSSLYCVSEDFYRVVGVNGDGDPVTDYSNIVQCV